MLSIRSAVLRSAVAAASAAARPSLSAAPAFAFAQTIRRPAQVNLAAVAAARAARYFSQTARVAEAEETFKPESEAEAEAEASTAEEKPLIPENSVANGANAQKNYVTGPETDHVIFVRNIVFDATEQHLGEAFEHYGSVTRVAIARDTRGLSRGYAFVSFENAEDVKAALEGADGSFWHGRRIGVKPRTAGPERAERTTREPSSSLYIGNLPYETTDADLNEIFKPVSGLKNVRVAVDRNTGWPRGFAHADFESVEDATAAMQFLSEKTLGRRQLRLDYANESPKWNAGWNPRQNEGGSRGYQGGSRGYQGGSRDNQGGSRGYRSRDNQQE